MIFYFYLCASNVALCVIMLTINLLTNNNIIMMKKEWYESPAMEVVEFANEGVICSSIDVHNPFSGSTEEEL